MTDMNLPLVVGAAFALFGIYLLKHALRNYHKAQASLTWPYTAGRLTAVRLWGLRLVDGEMKDAEKLAVEYRYEIENHSYSGRSAAFYTLIYPETITFANRHPVNTDVRVYYNPAQCAESVLIPGLKKDKPYSELILALLSVIIGASIAVMAWTGVIG